MIQLLKKVNTIKKSLILDFDNVIVNTIKAVCDLYEFKYKTHPNYKPPRWWEVGLWSCLDECPLLSETDLNEFFNNEKFFDIVEFMPWANDCIRELSDIYSISVCSIGSINNLRLKRKWLSENLPYIETFIGIDLAYNDKSQIDMSDCIFVDDCAANLNTSNAAEKICFGDIYEWNKNWNGIRTYNWCDLKLHLTIN